MTDPAAPQQMRLKILLPEKVFMDETVYKITAEAGNGSFTLKPRHIDFAAALVPGILSYVDETGETVYLAVDEGTLVKRGDRVRAAVRNAMRGPEIGELERTVEEAFGVHDEREKSARSAAAKIEAGFVRRFLEIEGHV